MNIPFIKKHTKVSREKSPAYRDWPILLLSFLLLLLVLSIMHIMSFARLFDIADEPIEEENIDIELFQEADIKYSEIQDRYFEVRENPPSIPAPLQ